MRAWILALVHTIWMLNGLQGEWTEQWDATSTGGLRPRAR